MDLREEVAQTYERLTQGEVTWLAMGELLERMDDSGMTFQEVFEGRRIDSIKRYLLAYRFVKMRRPDFLTSPNFNASPYAIAYLPTIYSKMSGPAKEDEFEKIIDRTLNGEFTEKDMKSMSVALDPSLSHTIRRTNIKKEGKDPDSAIDDKRNPNSDIAALSSSLDVVEHLIGSALQSNGYEKLRKTLGDKCIKVSIKLNCIADAEYLEQWEKRKGIPL